MALSVRKETKRKVSVYSTKRLVEQPDLSLSSSLKCNTRLQMNGLDLLGKIPDGSIPCVFFDPQYRGVLDYLGYGNEGKRRGPPLYPDLTRN